MLILPQRYKYTPLHRVTVDWSHSLARGLIACWLPGIYGGINLAGLSPPLAAQSATTFGNAPDGPGDKSTAGSSGYVGTAVTNQKSFSAGRTLFWRGQNIGLPPDFSTLIGTSYTNTDTSPYVVATIQFNVSTTPGWVAAWNEGGTVHDTWNLDNTTIASRTSGEIFSVGATFSVGGNVVLYKNGNQVGGAVSWGAGGAGTDTANATIGLDAWTPVTTRHANGTCNISCMWNRAFTANEMLQLQRWPYSFLKPLRLSSGLSFIVDYLRPDSDIVLGSWTNEAAGTTNIFQSIDEAAPPNDADYIQSGVNPSADIARFRISDPPASLIEPFRIRYRYAVNSTSTSSLTVRLKQGSTTIKSWVHTDATTTPVTVTQTLSSGEFATITDFTNLFLEFEATAP